MFDIMARGAISLLRRCSNTKTKKHWFSCLMVMPYKKYTYISRIEYLGISVLSFSATKKIWTKFLGCNFILQLPYALGTPQIKVNFVLKKKTIFL